MTLTLVTAPTTEPLTAADAKLRLSLTDADISDDVMKAFLKAARQMIDGPNAWPGIALNTQTWDLTIDQFEGWNRPLETGFYGSAAGYGPAYGASYDNQRALQDRRGIVIPLPPLQSITSVKYLDTDGNSQTLDPAIYVVEKGRPSHLVLANGASWPAVSPMPGAITIRFVAGYGDSDSDVEEPLRMAIALQAVALQQMASPSYWLSQERTEGIDSVTRSSSAGFAAFSTAVQAMLMPYRVWT